MQQTAIPPRTENAIMKPGVSSFFVGACVGPEGALVGRNVSEGAGVVGLGVVGDGEVGESVGDGVVTNVGAGVGLYVGDSVGVGVPTNVGDGVGLYVGDHVGLGESVGTGVATSVGCGDGLYVGDAVGDGEVFSSQQSSGVQYFLGRKDEHTVFSVAFFTTHLLCPGPTVHLGGRGEEGGGGGGGEGSGRW
jgi:hypothetical protein